MTTTAARESEIPFEDAPRRWAEIVRRADRDEQLRLVRDGDAPALVVMTEDAFDQAVEDAADIALCHEVLSRYVPPRDEAEAQARHTEFVAFLEKIANS